jgi:hypothetical protein
MEEKKEENSTLARLLGGAAGVTMDEARIVPGMLQTPLAMLSELKEKPYPSYMWGERLPFIDRLRAEIIRQEIGAPKIPIYIGPEDYVMNSPNEVRIWRWLKSKFPNLLKNVDFETPHISTRAGSLSGIAHELGHAKPSPIGVLASSPVRVPLRAATLLGGIGAALSESEEAQKAAPYIAGAGALPSLAEEGRAWYHAIRGMKRAEGTKAALETLARGAPAFGTHAFGAVPVILAPIVAKAVKDYMENRKGQEKEAAEIQLKTEGKLKSSPSRAWATEGPKPKTSTPGKAVSTKINIPSKRKFYRDMQRQMSPGKGQRLSVKEASVLGYIGTSLATMPVKNFLAHVLLNTKASPKRIRTFVENIGDEYLRAGFRHALIGKKVSPASTAGMLSGTVGGAGPMMMYNQGHEYGKSVFNTLSKLPGIDAKTPFRVLRAADTAARGTLKTAPIGGILGGAGYGYVTGKTKKEPMPLKSIAAGALTGGLIGKGAKHFVPQAPPVKQLRWVREKIVEPTLKGSESKIGKMLDRMAK